MTSHSDTNRHAILSKALELAPFEGWTASMLHRAAREAGLPELEADRLFPGGVMDVLDLHAAEADRMMLEALPQSTLKTLKIRERIAALVRTRLEQAEPHKEALRRAVAVSLLPPHIPTATKTLWRTMDAMWRAAGDTSSDFNYYSKRLLLSKVYTSTFLFWLNDASDGHADSWAFLDRRIAAVLTFGKTLADAKSRTESWGDKAAEFLRQRTAGRRAS